MSMMATHETITCRVGDCGEEFRGQHRRQAYADHIRDEHGVGEQPELVEEFVCPQCAGGRVKFPTEAELDRHGELLHGPMTCPESGCRWRFPDNQLRTRHRKREHGWEGEPPKVREPMPRPDEGVLPPRQPDPDPDPGEEAPMDDARAQLEEICPVPNCGKGKGHSGRHLGQGRAATTAMQEKQAAKAPPRSPSRKSGKSSTARAPRADSGKPRPPANGHSGVEISGGISVRVSVFLTAEDLRGWDGERIRGLIDGARAIEQALEGSEA